MSTEKRNIHKYKLLLVTVNMDWKQEDQLESLKMH